MKGETVLCINRGLAATVIAPCKKETRSNSKSYRDRKARKRPTSQRPVDEEVSNYLAGRERPSAGLFLFRTQRKSFPLGVSGPAADGFRSNQNRGAAVGTVAHLERVSICKVGRDVAVVTDRNEGARLSQMDVVSVVFKSMRKQTRSHLLAATHCGQQHRAPPRPHDLPHLTT